MSEGESSIKSNLDGIRRYALVCEQWFTKPLLYPAERRDDIALTALRLNDHPLARAIGATVSRRHQFWRSRPTRWRVLEQSVFFDA